MNQILGKQFYEQNNIYSFNTRKYKLIFLVFFLLCIIFIILFISNQYKKIKKEKFSKDLINNYSITTLYDNSSNDYTIEKSSSNSEVQEPFVIGLISINKIDIIYPILSFSNDELLKIAPCRFYGPEPNTKGNLCIAGHNYANNKIFGKLYLLDIGDIIDIYDLSGNIKNYVIYKKDEVAANDFSCLSQDTSNLCEITLITCNTLKGTRHIIKAKENR